MGCLSISTLGSFTVSLDGRPVDSFEYNKIRALLAYLVVEADRPHRRETLAGLLWPDQSQKAALDSLRNALSKLRQAIGDRDSDPPYLLISKEEIKFNPASDYWLDVRRFSQLLEECRTHRHRRIECCVSCTDRLTQAASLYHGEFLEGFSLADSDLFEDWAAIKREKLSQMSMDALQLLASTYEWRSEYDQALAYAQRQLELDPCHEDAYIQAIRLFGLLGKRTEACELYEKCREQLADELEVEPTDETTRLYEQIKYGMFQVSANRLRINNLPPDLTSFVGRGRELDEINLLLEDPNCRLLTLVGPGGVGKTRLVIAAAGQQMEAFPNGACFVPLAGVSSVESIVPSILQALGLKQAEQVDLKQQLINYLQDKELIIILDNFEHLVEGAGLVSELLEQALHLITLVTSRQRLGLQAEWVFEVNGLSYPTGKAVQDLAAYEAVMLFQQRLHQVKPRTTLFQDDLTAVSRICQIVEGLPLGVELAASAVRRRSIEQVAQAIESGTEDLKVSYKDVPERHRSIRAVFEHSYRLLSHEEQSTFIGLAVFRGGFTAEAAEQVAEATPEILGGLVEHSLVRYNPQTERYDLHRMVRQYALDKLRAQGLEPTLSQRHSNLYLQSLERWGIEQEGAGQVAALTEMDQQLADIRSAWGWACQHQDLRGLTQGSKGLCRYYFYRSRPVDGDHDCQVALDMLEGMAELNPQGLRLKVNLLHWQSLFQLTTERIDVSNRRQTLEQCIQILEGLQQAGEEVRVEMSYILNDLGYSTSDLKQAIRLDQHSLDLARQVGNKRSQALSLIALANIYFNHNDFWEAERCFQESLALWRLLGDPRRIADTLQALGGLFISQGKIQPGLQAARESAQLYRSQGDNASYADGLSNLGLILWFGRQWEEADKAYEENIPYLQEMSNRNLLCDDSSRWSIIKMLMGHYEEARVMADRSMELANQLNDKFAQACSNYALGGVALAQGQAEQASLFLEKAAVIIKNIDLSNWAWVVGTWTLALSRLGQLRQAQELLVEALQVGVEQSYLSLSYTLPAAALLLAITGQVERAVELCALIDECAMCGKTPWFEDVVGRTIAVLAATLPLEVVEAARQRGTQRDLFSTAAELLAEFKEQQ